ncbi:alpha-amylase [Flavobacteriaceae bacterium UJ101]|nr:alpha-amylase [Flavobacteriaceae bacterium UJ101]
MNFHGVSFSTSNIYFMKNKIFKISLLSLLTISFIACDNDDDNSNENTTISGSDLTQYSSGSEIMMQSFFWDVPEGGIWWDFIKGHMDDWAIAGIDKVWLPQFAKSGSGAVSMGYDPADYFDLGEYNQYGTVETRFGSKEELLSLIDEIHNQGMEVIADIVINHNGGGAEELNTLTGETKYTLFNQATQTNLSGRFDRTWQDFHPNNEFESDEEAGFFPERDLCLQCPRVQDELWLNTNSVAQYYKNELGIDGWRFDYVKGFNPNVVKQWNEATGGLFSVGENFDGNATVLKDWVDASASSAFDFAAFYNMEKAFDSQRNLTLLNDNALFKIYPDKAVTFAGNHDTDDREEQGPTGYINTQFKNLAYAYILTHPGTPTIFYSDYEQKLDKTELDNLMLINKTIASGDLTVINVSKQEYIARREGKDDNPGLIIYFNISSSPKTQTVLTNWKNATLFDYSNNTTFSNEADLPITDANGLATLTVEPNSYAIWSIK